MWRFFKWCRPFTSIERLTLLASILVTCPAHATTNAILFVTQIPMPVERSTHEVTSSVCNVSSPFANHLGDTASCGRGGALWIRYPDGTLTNLTLLAGFGSTNTTQQGPNCIAVREPSVHWDGTRALFSMVVGAPTGPTDTNRFVWQLYEIANFTTPDSLPLITRIPTQPPDYNNVSPTYGTDGRIIFASDRPRDGQPHLYPQREEYLQLPTVTGLWSLDPATGDLFLMEHSPSGSFKPFVDSAGRVLFTRWDHLARDVQAVTDRAGSSSNHVFNWSDESPTAIATTNTTEVFPEPRPSDTNALAGTNMRGNAFNIFLPWQINEDGTAEEIVNHIGRHELLAQIPSATFTNDPNIVTLTANQRVNTNFIANFFLHGEDPNTPGLLYAIDALDIGTHTAGQIVTLTAATNINPDAMLLNYITPKSTASPNAFGLYRDPLPLQNGVLVAAFTPATNLDSNVGSPDHPQSAYNFRLVTLKPSGSSWTTNALLTPGFSNTFSYWVGTNQITYTGPLWELNPAEVAARPMPAPQQAHVEDIEAQVFAEEGVSIPAFQSFLVSNNLALVVSRNLTTRDHADRQQPFNLRIPSSGLQSLGATGTIYNVLYMQLMQADHLRGFKPDGITPAPGRRVLAQPMHDPNVDNPPNPSGPAGSVRLGIDGLMASLVPARRAMSWQLTDIGGAPIVRDRYWLSFQPGEIRTCTSCHGLNTTDQASHPRPTNKPEALRSLLRYWKQDAAPPGSTGYIVFLTNRDGNYEIYRMAPDGTGATNLTRNAAIDVIPRVSYDGTKIAFMSDRDQPGYNDVWVMNSDGSNPINVTKTNLFGASLHAAALSPDNSKVVYMAPGLAGYAIWVSNLDGTGRTNLTTGAVASDNFPYWSYDGNKIVFSSFRDNNGGEEIYIMNANGSAQTRLTFVPGRDFYPTVNPERTKIAFNSERGATRQIYIMNLDGSGQTNLSNNAFFDNTPYFSPDGKKISFTSFRGGSEEVYTMNLDGSAQTQITTNAAQEAYPAWSSAPPPFFTANIQFASPAYAVNESAGSASIAVSRTGTSVGAFTLVYATTNGTALAGTNYISSSGTVSWADGETGLKNFPVPILDDGLVSTNKSLALTLAGLGAGTLTNATLTIVESPYDTWKRAHFSTNANNAAIAGDAVDLDQDGLETLAEYALGGDPNLPGNIGLLAATTDGLTFTRNLQATDVTFSVEALDDLVPNIWTVIATKPGPAPWSSPTGAFIDDPNTGLVTITEPTAPGPRFYRLRITHP